MSGDCDLCGSYDHVETGCDAYDCRTCEDEGWVCVSFSLDSPGRPAIESCPDCTKDRQ
jgi:hypothetical protein